MSKSLLLITEEFPYPPTKGTWVDVWGQILFFKREDWDIILACRESPHRNKDCSHVPIDIKVHFFPPKVSRWRLSESNKTIQEAQDLIDQYKPQIVFCQYPLWVPLISSLNLQGAEIWFRPHNFELAQSFIKIPNTLSWKFWKLGNIIWFAKWARLIFYDAPQIFILEYQMHHLADRLFYISWGDMKLMTKIYRGSANKKWILPFLDEKMVPVKENKDKVDVYYIGVGYDSRSTMQLSGANKLLKQIIPAVELALPKAFRFHFIGRGSKTYLKEYASDTIILHDFVEDLSAFLQQMDICCVPVEVGWGCKIKVIEALAAGIPVVAASQSLFGLPPTGGAYFNCQSIEDYVEGFRALRDFKQRNQMATESRELYASYRLEAERTLKEALDKSRVPA
jgi:glycosyltransferase involved in cell wall biosynthesis